MLQLPYIRFCIWLNYESIVGFQSDEVNHYLLSTQLQLLWTKFIECDEKTLPGIINYLKHRSDVDR